jgi:hypothetical protein
LARSFVRARLLCTTARHVQKLSSLSQFRAYQEGILKEEGGVLLPDGKERSFRVTGTAPLMLLSPLLSLRRREPTSTPDSLLPEPSVAPSPTVRSTPLHTRFGLLSPLASFPLSSRS